MSNDKTTFDHSNSTLSEEFEQYMRELAGTNVGRMNRFIDEEDDPQVMRAKERRKDAERALKRQVEDQAIIEQRLESLERRFAYAETASYEALTESQENLAGILILLTRMKKNAHKLDDGRAVFLSRTGEWGIDEHGDQLTDEELTSIEWQPDKPSAEDYLALSEQEEAARAEVESIEAYRQRLGEASARLSESDELSLEDLDELELGISAMPNRVAEKYAALTGDAAQDVARERSASKSVLLRNEL